jgi:putative SOS response-associated peptidase YedK
VPGTGLFEWATAPEQKRKAPYHIRLRSGVPFGFAGIYTPPTDDVPGTYAIVITRPNELLSPIHDRMPAILAPVAAVDPSHAANARMTAGNAPRARGASRPAR